MKKILIITLVGILCFILAGCGNKNSKTDNKNKLVEKFNKVNVGMTKSEVNSILTLSDETNGKYEDDKISVTFKNDKVSMLQLKLSYNSEEIKNSKTDLREAHSLSSKLKTNEKVYYQDLVNAFKTDGQCVSKNSNGCSEYQWADDKGNYMTVSLNVYSDGYVISMSGKS